MNLYGHDEGCNNGHNRTDDNPRLSEVLVRMFPQNILKYKRRGEKERRQEAVDRQNWHGNTCVANSDVIHYKVLALLPLSMANSSEGMDVDAGSATRMTRIVPQAERRKWAWHYSYAPAK